eukprot:1407001-Pyramimonas_sp.AAC.1
MEETRDINNSELDSKVEATEVVLIDYEYAMTAERGFDLGYIPSPLIDYEYAMTAERGFDLGYIPALPASDWSV